MSTSASAAASSGGVAAINHFLSHARRLALSAADRAGRPLVGVLGNEGGDMDSVISAMYTAMALDRGLLSIGGRMVAATCTSATTTTTAVPHPVYVPLINFPARDLPLRGDILGLLDRSEVDHTQLLSVMDAGGDEILANCAALVLVDHNKLRKSQLALQDRVAAIIDHHADEGLSTTAEPREIRLCGSAASLVAKLCGGGKACAATLPCANPLLLAPIVADTMNFDPSMKKSTPIDIAAAGGLLGLDDATDASLSRACSDLYGYLNAKKFDVSGLTVSQNLRRDFKAFTLSAADGSRVELGVAAWLEPVAPVIERHGARDFANACADFALNEQGSAVPLDALVVMFAFGKGADFGRQLLWMPTATDPERCARAKALVDGFVAHGDQCRSDAGPGFESTAELTELFAGQQGAVRCVVQRGTTVSRKGLVPMLATYTAAQAKL